MKQIHSPSWMRVGFIPFIMSDEYGYSEVIGTSGAINPIVKTHVFPGYKRPLPLVSDFLMFNLLPVDVRIVQRNLPELAKCELVPDDIKIGLGDKLLPCYGYGTRDKYAMKDESSLLPDIIAHVDE